MERQENEVEDLQEGGEVEVMDADERGGGAGNEDAELVEESVGGVEGAVGGEWAVGQGEEEGG